MRKSLPHLITLTVIFVVTIIIAYLTKAPYANAFFYKTVPLVISFCAFLAIDVLRWIIRMASEGAKTQSKRQELGWTIGLVVLMVYLLWRTWNYYSLWQICLVAMVCVVLAIGLLVRLYSKWDVDCVRWNTWSICCLVVTMCIGVSVLLWKPMTVTEAEELTIASTGDNSFDFFYIDASKSLECPLGYYMWNQKEEDGSGGWSGEGRAVVYLGENQEYWRNPTPQ